MRAEYVNIDDLTIEVIYQENPEVPEDEEGHYLTTLTMEAVEMLLHGNGFRKIGK